MPPTWRSSIWIPSSSAASTNSIGLYLKHDGDVDNVVLFFGSVNNVEDGDVDNVGNIVEADVDEVPGSAGGDVDDIGNIVEGDVVDLPGGAGGDPGGEEREQVVDGVRGERQRDRRHLARLLVPAVRFAINKLYKLGRHYTLYSKCKEKISSSENEIASPS